jgi:hypothetical protein
MFDEHSFEPFIGHDDDDLHILADLQTTIETYSQDLLPGSVHLKKKKRKKETNTPRNASPTALATDHPFSPKPTHTSSSTGNNAQTNEAYAHEIQEKTQSTLTERGYNNSASQHSNFDSGWKEDRANWNGSHTSTMMQLHHQVAYTNQMIPMNAAIPHFERDMRRFPVHNEYSSNFHFSSTGQYSGTTIGTTTQHTNLQHIYQENTSSAANIPLTYPNYTHFQTHHPVQTAILPSLSALNLPDSTSIPDASMLLSSLRSNHSESTAASTTKTIVKSKPQASFGANSRTSKGKKSRSNSTLSAKNSEMICKITGEKVNSENAEALLDWPHESIDDSTVQASWRDLNKQSISNIFDAHILTPNDLNHHPTSLMDEMSSNGRDSSRLSHSKQNAVEEIREMLGIDPGKDLEDLATIDQTQDYDIIFNSNENATAAAAVSLSGSKRGRAQQSTKDRKEKSISSTCLKFVTMFGTNRSSTSPTTSTNSIESINAPSGVRKASFDYLTEVGGGVGGSGQLLGLEAQDRIDMNMLAVDHSSENIRIDHAAERLGVHVRRIYEVLSILELLSLVKTKRGQFQWNGTKEFTGCLAKIQADGMKKYPSARPGGAMASDAMKRRSLSVDTGILAQAQELTIHSSSSSTAVHLQHSTDVQDDANALVSIFNHSKANAEIMNLQSPSSYVGKLPVFQRSFDASEGLAMLTDYATRYINHTEDEANTEARDENSFMPRTQRAYTETSIHPSRSATKRELFMESSSIDQAPAPATWYSTDDLDDKTSHHSDGMAALLSSTEYADFDKHLSGLPLLNPLPITTSITASSSSSSYPDDHLQSSTVQTKKEGGGKVSKSEDSLVVLCRQFLELFLVGVSFDRRSGNSLLINVHVRLYVV